MRNWPTEVPILTAADILQNGDFEQHRYKECKRCIIGWRNYVFGEGRPYIVSRHCPRMMQIGEATDRAIKHIYGRTPFIITEWNDKMASKHEVARVWNIAMALLGYIVGNLEAKTAKRIKDGRKTS